jgi:peptide/nickel transport system substrate-binding protein
MLYQGKGGNMSKRGKTIVVVGLVSLFLVFLTMSTSAAAPRGKLTIAVSTLADEPIDPHRSKTNLDRPMASHIGEGLTVRDLEGKLVTSLAESWRIREDQVSWEWKLKKGVKFHNGMTMTAEDVKFSMERCVRPEFKFEPRSLIVGDIERYEIVDDHTIIVHTKGPRPIIPQNFVRAAIIPKKYVEQVGDDTYGEKGIAAGPFKFVKRARLQYAELEAFEDFHDKSRVPRVKNVVLRVVPEITTRLAALKTGEADIIEGVVGPLIQEVKNIPGVKLASSKKTAVLDMAFHDLYFDAPSPLKDRRVRLALRYAINMDAIIQRLYFGEATVGVGVTWPYDISWAPELKPYPYDLEKAKKLLAEAGYANGFELKIHCYVSSSTPLIPETAEAISGFWSKIGVRAKIDRTEAGIYFSKWRNKEWRGVGLQSIPAPLDCITSQWYLLTSKGDYSYSKIPKVDELIAKIKKEMDPAKRKAMAQEVSRIYYNDLPRIALQHVNTNWGLGPRVKEWKVMASMPYTVGLERVVLKD